MRRHTKPQRVSVSAPIVQPTGKQTMVERVKRILADNSPLSAEDWFLLTQVHLICLFRRAKTESRKKKITRYIVKREDGYLNQKKGKESPEKSFTSQDFLTLNQWIANQDAAERKNSTHEWINKLIRRVKDRKRKARRELRIVKK